MMKKRVFGLILALVLCLGLLPGTAWAEELPYLNIENKNVTAENMNDVLKDGTVSAAYADGKWTIRLTGASLTAPISVGGGRDAEVILSGENAITLNRENGNGIHGDENLTISGDGSLTIKTMDGSEGIFASGKLVISGASVTAVSPKGHALRGVGGIEISGGSTVSATAENEDVVDGAYRPAIYTDRELVVSGSTVEANSEMSEGIDALEGIRISNGSTVTGTSLSYALWSPKTISVSGSTVDMRAKNNAAVLSAEGIQITEGANVTVYGTEGCLIVRDVDDDSKTGTLLVDGSVLSAEADSGNGIFVNGQAAIQNKAEVTAISRGYFNSHNPGYGLGALGLVIDGSKVSASAVSSGRTQGGIYVGTRDTPAGGDMTVKGDSEVTASGTVNCGITVEGTLSIEGGSVTSSTTSGDSHGTDVGDTLLILKGTMDSTGGYRGVNVGTLLDIRNGAAFHAKSTSVYKDEAVLVISKDGIKLGDRCVEKTGGTPGASKIFQGGIQKDATVFVDNSGTKLQEVTITTDSADYTAVNEAIAKIPEDLSVYTGESVAALNSAKDAVNWDLPSAQQDTVNGYAKAIEDAIAGLIRAYTVRFMDGGQTLSAVRVQSGRGVTQPADPTRDGYTFGGWHTDADCTMAYNFSTPVTGNLTLYAKWNTNPVKPDPPLVTPERPSGGGSSPTTYRPDVSQPDHGSVTVSPRNPQAGDKVTVKPVPDDGYEVDSVTVTDRKGRPVAVTEHQDGTYTFTQPQGTVTIEVELVPLAAAPWTSPYTDVTEGRWYSEAVRFVTENGLMSGYDNQFAPGAFLTRAQLAQVLYNCAGRPATEDVGSFDDVRSGAWYSQSVAWAVKRGVVSGYGGGRFGPNDPITREQLAVMLWQYAGKPAPPNLLLPFDDADKVSPWAADALRWAVGQGILSGKGGGVLDPGGTATRAEAAQMLKSFLEKAS